jgi:hypothetical protein
MVSSLTARSLRLALVVCPLVAAALTLGVTPASAAIVKLQTGTLATGTSGNVTPTLPSSSTAGTLLVAVLTNKTNNVAFSAPVNWTQAITGNNACCGRTDIWYYKNNPGGISSAAFTASSGTVSGELSEWNGVDQTAPLDQTKQQNHGSGSSFGITTAGNLTASNELGIAVFQNSGTAATSQIATSPWSHLFNDLTQNRVADYDIGLPSGSTATDTETFSPNLSSMAAIATFKPLTCSGGSLGLTASSGSSSFAGVTLNGSDQATTTTVTLKPDDETTGHAGWNITGTSTTFNDGSGHTLPTIATTLTSTSSATTGGNCVMPTNSVGSPVTMPAAAVAPTAVKMYNAAAATGQGPTNVTFNFQLAVPANAYHGTFTSTWTFAIVSGP